MTGKRWRNLMTKIKPQLTKEELAKGWHFCIEWDDLLIGPGMSEECYCGNELYKIAKKSFDDTMKEVIEGMRPDELQDTL